MTPDSDTDFYGWSQAQAAAIRVRETLEGEEAARRERLEDELAA